MVDEGQFRFDWETLFEAQFLFSSQEPVTCIFSKAYIQDIDLINMAFDESEPEPTVNSKDTQENAEQVESDYCSCCSEPTDLAESAELPNKAVQVSSDGEHRQQEDGSEEVAGENNSQVPSYDVGEQTEGANAEHYDEEEEEEEHYEQMSKSKAKSIRARLKKMDFDEYWERTGGYLVDICKANDFMPEMREALRRHKPEILIGVHRSKNPIRGVTKMLPSRDSLDEDDYLATYTAKVKELAEQDFLKYRANSTAAKCKSFLHKLAQFGYVHGFEHFGSDNASSSQKRPVSESVESSPPRKLPCYEGMELFTDVEYESYESLYYGNQQMVSYFAQDSRRQIKSRLSEMAQESSSELPSGVDGEMSTRSDKTPDKKNFDFSFDPDRDAYLVAKDADKVMMGDKEIMKYWFQRYRLFSKLNEGVLMDREGWFSVTPEHIGAHIADRMVTRPGCVILDAFTGVGGNAIQFALKGAYVIAFDLDPVRLRCALQNARVYGVADYITFVCGNFFHMADSFFGSRKTAKNNENDDAYYGVDAVFLSPPWGGPSYLREKVYDLDRQEPNGYEIFRIARRISPNIAYFLPRNTSVKQLISLAGPGGRVEVEHDVLNGKLKTLTAYYGDLVAS